MTKALQRMIEEAQQRESFDNHLTNRERFNLVKAYKAENPEEVLPVDYQEAYLNIIFNQ